MITIHKSNTDMMALIWQWHEQHQHLEWLGWEDEDTFTQMLCQQYSIDWDLGLSTLPDHNHMNKPKQVLFDYTRGGHSAEISQYHEIKRFFTMAGSQRNNRRRLALIKQWDTEWFPGVVSMEQQVEQVQRVGFAVKDLIPTRERYRSDKLQTWHILKHQI